MDPITIGQQVKAKYPQYQNLSDEEVGKRTLAKYPQYGAASQAKQVVQQPIQQEDNPFVGLLNSVGGGQFSHLTGAAQAPGIAVRQATNNYGFGGPIEGNQFFSNEEKKQMQNNPSEAGRNMVFNDAKNAAVSATSALSLLQLLSTLAPYSTQKGRAGLTEQRAKESPATVDPNKVLTKIQEEAGKKLGPTAQTPSKQWMIDNGFLGNGENLTSGSTPMNMADVLNARKWAGADYNNPVNKVIQRVMSDTLHENVKSTQLPDKLYHVAASIDPKKIIKILGGGALGALGYDLFKSVK